MLRKQARLPCVHLLPSSMVARWWAPPTPCPLSRTSDFTGLLAGLLLGRRPHAVPQEGLQVPPLGDARHALLKCLLPHRRRHLPLPQATAERWENMSSTCHSCGISAVARGRRATTLGALHGTNRNTFMYLNFGANALFQCLAVTGIRNEPSQKVEVGAEYRWVRWRQKYRRACVNIRRMAQTATERGRGREGGAP